MIRKMPIREIPVEKLRCADLPPEMAEIIEDAAVSRRTHRDMKHRGHAWIETDLDGRIRGWAILVSGFVSVFVAPEFRRQGIGRRLVWAIKADTWDLRARANTPEGADFFKTMNVELA